MTRFSKSTLRPRAFVLWLLFVAVPLPLVLIGTLVFTVDPFQHYRPSDWIRGDERHFLPGIARHRAFDTVVAGDSISQNFTRTPTARALGGKPINLSISGGTLFEIGNLLEVALRKGTVRRVVWGIGPDRALIPQKTRLASYPGFLYDDNRLNDVHYLYNFNAVQMSAAKLAAPHKVRRSVETMSAWFRDPEHRPGRKAALRDLAEKVGGQVATPEMPAMPHSTAPDPERLATARAHIDEDLLALVRTHRHVRFDILIPPYSTLYFAWQAHFDPETDATALAALDYLIGSLVREPNVTVHFFGRFEGVADNLDNYKDLTHFSVAVSHRLLHEVREGSYVLTPENYRTRLAQWWDHVRTYDVERDLREAAAP